MFNPISTYRIQFHKGFTFADFSKVMPYLQQLGVKTIYASPIFKAVPDSVHGYDVTDANLINPEIGTLEELQKIGKLLRSTGMSWIQDIVPNHMALHTDNKWLMDVLEHGESSAYSGYFDIDWKHPSFAGKLMMPILGGTLQEAIDAKEVLLASKAGKLYISCYGALLPCNMGNTPKRDGGHLDEMLERTNSNPDALREILDNQHYVLTNWRDTEKEINYRRFFTVNGLICLNIQQEQVFNDYHGLIKRLCDDDLFQGVRVDHIDGLYDPREYLDRLRAMVGEDKYIVVEKILEQEEELPKGWPVQGTTGYDFLGMVNNLFTEHGSKKAFTKLYSKQTTEQGTFAEKLYDRKSLILNKGMQGELDNLYRLFVDLDLAGGDTAIAADKMKEVLGEFLIQCPVYKFYGTTLPLVEEEAGIVKNILDKIADTEDAYKAGVDILRSLFLESTDPSIRQKALQFYKRSMQFTGPLMAKGMEDTLMYNYNRFIGHNDVGDTPHAFGYSVADFHKYMETRMAGWPATMNGTSTHDTKRGEDARARLNVITDMAEDWLKAVKHWQKAKGKDDEGIDSNDAYFILQSIVACHPMPGHKDDFDERFKAYIQKALREAKVHTGWAEPNEAYEEKVAGFIGRQLNTDNGAIANLGSLFTSIADAGIVNSLAQVLLRFTCPGMPDTYQGTELWDLSMVDPDNRRPVDYGQRHAWLGELNGLGKDELAAHLWETRYTGKIKLWLINALLRERAAEPEVFDKGAYIPLKVKGKYKDNVIAFVRRHRNVSYAVIAPIHLAALAKQQHAAIADIDWKDTSVILPSDIGEVWTYAFEGLKADGTIAMKDALNLLPVCLLKAKTKESGRSAGILMPVFSLPSAFGIGDFGPEAYSFIDFLADSGQRYWQILPLSPILAGIDASPYSSISGMAGNTLFISPELLVEDGLLVSGDIENYRIENTGEVDYALCDKTKDKLCEKAYSNYLSGDFAGLKNRFASFYEKQQYWLHDFALFVVIKRHHGGLPWHKWPSNFKKRDTAALSAFATANKDELDKIKWQQFIADDQWQRIRAYCKRKDIQLFGDMPFYVSYDSADVWAAPHLFSLDKEGNMTGISGVPPDYFSCTGQLWNMPTYDWNAVKADNYKWWMRRLGRNLELFDVIRLDHFRAFEAYWQVPAGEETAVNGSWMKGPGMDFFNAVCNQLGHLPFVAEDLGYEMDDVYKLREKTGLPGMKVVQFAWGANMPVSPDIPHNYPTNCFVYTGTHDNNTTKGWYMQETGKEERKRIEDYTCCKIKEDNIADTLIRVAYSSVAKVAILPMPDVLGYGAEARINLPGSSTGNWIWRMAPGTLTKVIEQRLRRLVVRYNR